MDNEREKAYIRNELVDIIIDYVGHIAIHTTLHNLDEMNQLLKNCTQETKSGTS